MLAKKQRDQIKAVFKKYPIVVGYLFGSQALAREDKLSDYDFALQLSERVPALKYFDYKLALTDELLKIVDSKFVDMVILNDLKIPLLLKYNIIKDGQVIYEKDKAKKENLEFEIMRDWFDWQYFEDLWATIFIKNLAKGKFL